MADKTSVTRDDSFKAYRVRGGWDGHEWATICVRDWTMDGKPVGERTRYCGEILIHSSFGSWGHQWAHLGQPFPEFLLDVEFDYFFTKLMGSDLQVFDGEGSVRHLRQQIVEHRKTADLTKGAARALWQEIDACQNECEDSNASFVEQMRDIADRFNDGYSFDSEIESLSEAERDAVVQLLQEPWELTTTKAHPQATGFWRDLWPVFVEQLRGERGQAEAAPVPVLHPALDTLAKIDAALGMPEDGCNTPAATLARVRQVAKLWNHVRSFVEHHELTCLESVYQRDSVVTEHADFVGDACRLVGFMETGDDDE